MTVLRVYVLGTVGAGVDLIRCISPEVTLAGIIGLSDRSATDAISGFHYMKPVAEGLGVPFVEVESYALSRAEDRATLSKLEIDVLIVSGWQRLVPDWLIAQCKIGVIGSHGSPKGISGGRGRSPQNWALILGASRFSVSIFFIDPGIDSGNVIATRTFPLGVHDDISSSYAKVTAHCGEMMVEAFRSGAIAERRAEPQSEHGAYLPQRLPEDGAIDFARDADSVTRFVAALTRPYPGAFALIGGQKVVFFRARPFESTGLSGWQRALPGEIVMVLESGAFIVRVGEGQSIIVDEWSTENASQRLLRVGCRFESEAFESQMQRICNRHTAKFPQLPLMDDLLAQAGPVRRQP
jgi:methionyl-tRNA formyltransferase